MINKTEKLKGKQFFEIKQQMLKFNVYNYF